MQHLQSFFSGQRNTGYQRQTPTQDPSMRGGLPKVVDMLKAVPAESVQRKDINAGNRVLLPGEILQTLSNQFYGNLPHPMIFSVSTIRTKKTVYVGVLEFVAPENTVVMPDWIFQKLQLNQGEMIWLGIVDSMPKASFAKIRPHKTEFIELPDPKAVLEIQLRNFVSLTKGDTIQIQFANKTFLLDLVDLKPETPYNTAIIIDTDLLLEFEQPLDYVEPKEVQQKQNQKSQIIEATRIDGKKVKIENEKQKVYDPREHWILNGIRKEWQQKMLFQGQGVQIKGK